MDLSVVIVNWNSGSHLSRLIASLQPLKGELACILIADNCSEDDSLKDIAFDEKTRLIGFKHNKGFAGAANEAIRQVQSRFILLLNPDIEVNPQSIRQLYGYALEHSEAAIVCGPLVDESGKVQSQFQIRPLPTWSSVISDVLFLDELRGRVPSEPRPSGSGFRNPLPDGRGSEVDCVEIEQPAAAFWLLREEAWQTIGGFDERFYPAWFEDVDFCKRVREKGWKVLYFSGIAPLRHRGGLALEQLGYSSFVEIYYANLLKYLRKHHGRSYPFLWLPVKCGTWIRKYGIGR